jgi:hypothetical protein
VGYFDISLTLFLFNINPLDSELNPISHLLALLGTHHILHVNRIRVNVYDRSPQFIFIYFYIYFYFYFFADVPLNEIKSFPRINSLSISIKKLKLERLADSRDEFCNAPNNAPYGEAYMSFILFNAYQF